MNNIESRIEKLEKSTGVGKQEKVWLIVVTGESVWDGLEGEGRIEAIETHKKQADAKVKAAITEYLAAHPECSEQDINIITVINEKTKQMTLTIKADAIPVFI